MPKIPIQPEQIINKISEEQFQINNEKLFEIKNKYLNDKQVENFFINKTIYVYDYQAKIHNKLKGNLSEKQFTIHGKKDTIIYIQDILSIDYCNVKHPLIDILTVNSGYKPFFYIVLKTEENQWIIGLQTEEKLKKWKNGFDLALINLNFFMNDVNFNIEINKFKNEMAQNQSKIIDEPINSDNFINNKFKKIILYRYIKGKKILQLIEDILIYKKLILTKEYEKAQNKFSEIFKNYIEENKSKKSSKDRIITEKKFDDYLDMNNKLKKITKEKNDILKDLLKPDLFDNIFEEVNKLYINPLIDKINKEITNKKNNEVNDKRFMESIIAYNCLKNYKMEKMDSYLDL